MTKSLKLLFLIPIAQQSEWALLQYSVLTVAFVGFAKFYMETEGKHTDCNAA